MEVIKISLNVNWLQQIEELERQIEEAKGNCAQLSLHIENHKKQKIMKQQTEKA